MARKKGKASHRIHDWQQELRSGTKSERTAGRSRHTQRAVKLPSYRLEFPELNLEMLPKVEGMVVGFFPGGVIVRAPSRELASVGDRNRQDMICGIAKTFRAPEGVSALAVGDIVTAALASAEHVHAAEDDKVRADGLILSRQARQSALVRPAPRSGKRTDKYETETTEKVIVANMDMLMIVTSVAQPAFRAAVVDRFLIIAERSELQPVLVVNKIDLGPLDEEKLADFVQLGLRIVRCSAVTGEGLDDLRAVLSGRKSVLAGASGVGKSALVNALVPSARAATRPIRMRDQRGRHTTAATVIYELPAPGGEGTPAGIIVDTPGVRELGINLTAAKLPWYFPEFQQYSQGCKFNNCTHTHEPDCAVQSAVEDGLIQPRRYESYLRILETLEK